MRFYLRAVDRVSSHMAVLMKFLAVTEGPVLEMGAGLFSTPLIHYTCVPKNRLVVTLENNEKWCNEFKCFEHEYHRVVLVDEWDNVNIERQWGLAFIDHAPGDRRKEDIKRLAYYARFIVVHDTNGRHNKNYHYNEVFPMFKYQYHFGYFQPQTSVLSMFEDPGAVQWWL